MILGRSPNSLEVGNTHEIRYIGPTDILVLNDIKSKTETLSSAKVT